MNHVCTVPDWSDWLGIALLHSVWMITLLVGAICLAGSYSRQSRTFERIGVMGMHTTPLLLLTIFFALQSGWLPIVPGFASYLILGIPVARWLTYFWLVAATLGCLRWVAAWCFVWGLCRQEFEEGGTISVGVRGKVFIRLLATEWLAGPVTVGVWQPLILVPQHVRRCLSAEQFELLMQHEVAHIRKYDFWWNAGQSLVEAIFVFQPALLILGKWIRAEREFACDDEVLERSVSPIGYARALALLEAGRPRAGMLPIEAQGAPLLARINRIVSQTAARPGDRRKYCWFSSVALSTSVLLAAAFFVTSKAEASIGLKVVSEEVDKPETHKSDLSRTLYCCPG